MNPTHRINLWSGPRNVSTALMYSWAQRADTRVIDEPLYAYFLKWSGAKHPGRADVLARCDSDGERVVRDVILGPSEKPVLFMKQMAHHLPGLDPRFLTRTLNVILTRDPAEMLPSLAKQIPEPELRDTGFAVQVNLLGDLKALGQKTPVLEATELLKDPEKVLTTLCERLGLPFDPAMLAWKAGPRPEDGIWAPHWYERVHGSTGFLPHKPKTEPFPERLKPLLEKCRPYYERLREYAIEA